MPTNTWPLEDAPMLPPLVLRPPHGPRLMRALVVILAAIFHVATAGWTLITNGPEGDLAGAAVSNHSLLPPAGTTLLHGPLAYWLSQASMAVYGGNEFAARLPVALAVVALVFLTLRLGERLGGGIWEGLLAAMILLFSPGMFTLGRMLTPLPLTAALVTAAVCCLQRGAEHGPLRRRWYLLAWTCWGLATLAGGWRAGAIPVGMVLLLVLFYPEARLRFRLLLSWEGAAVFAVTAIMMSVTGFIPFRITSIVPELTTPFWQLLGWQIGFLFPWSLLLVPPAFCVLGSILSLRRIEWEEALLLTWLAAAVALTALDPERTLFSSLNFWPPIAVWGALRLNTMHRRVFLYGCALTAVVAIGGFYLTQQLRQILPEIFPAKAQAIGAIPDYVWLATTPEAIIVVLAFAMFIGVVIRAETMQNRRFALLALCAAMIPAGFAFADIGAKFAPYFSDASLAHCVDANHEPRPTIYVDGNRFASSSLQFYLVEPLRRQVHYGGPTASQWSPPMVLVTTKSRLPYWKEALEGRFNVACESGENVMLMRQP